MSNDTARLARQWAHRKQAQAKQHLEDAGYFIREDTQAAIEHILATTTDPLTMADVEWDDEKHYLAGATSELTSNEVVMLGPRAGMIDCFRIETGKTISTTRNALTPNGKRYELVEVTDKPDQADEPEYPETLTTVEDYENAPVGTIVALNGCLPYVKRGRNDWSDAFGDTCSDKGMAGHTREVLRWGWDA